MNNPAWLVSTPYSRRDLNERLNKAKLYLLKRGITAPKIKIGTGTDQYWYAISNNGGSKK